MSSSLSKKDNITIDSAFYGKSNLFAQSFNISNDLADNLTNNTMDKMTLEEVVLAIIAKYTNTENHHLRKDVAPRYYVKARLNKELAETRNMVHNVDYDTAVAPKSSYGKFGKFLSKHVLQNIDKPINAISRFFETHLGERYEVKENGLLYLYDYQYVDQRPEARKRSGKERPFSLSTILSPSIKLKSGYYRRSHIEQRIVVNKEVNLPKEKQFDEKDYHKYITYHVFFFEFRQQSSAASVTETKQKNIEDVDIPDTKYTLYKNGKVVKTGLKLPDLLSYNISSHVTEHEKSAHSFNNSNKNVHYGGIRYHFLLDYKNTKDKYLFNDIFNVLEYCDTKKISIYDLYNMYLHIIKNLDKYMSKNGKHSFLIYDKRTLDKRFKNVINVLKKIKDVDTDEKGYLNINDIKFKDSRKLIIRILLSVVTFVTVDIFILPALAVYDTISNSDFIVNYNLNNPEHLNNFMSNNEIVYNGDPSNQQLAKFLVDNNALLYQEYGISMLPTEDIFLSWSPLIFENLFTHPSDSIYMIEIFNYMFLILLEIGSPDAIAQLSAYVFVEFSLNISAELAARLVAYDKIQITKADLDKMAESIKKENPTLSHDEIGRKLILVRERVYKKLYSKQATDEELRHYIETLKKTKYDPVAIATMMQTISVANDRNKRASTSLGFLKTFGYLTYIWSITVRIEYAFIKYVSTSIHFDNLIYENYYAMKKFKKDNNIAEYNENKEKLNLIQDKLPLIVDSRDSDSIYGKVKSAMTHKKTGGTANNNKTAKK